MECRPDRERPERGCSLAGFVVPNNYPSAIPAGVTKSSTPYVTQSTPPWHNFGPRLGFAWQPTSSSRFVVRGGAGIFYEFINGVQAAYFPLRVMPGSVNVQKSPLGSWEQPGVPPAAVPGPPGGYGFTPLWANFGDRADFEHSAEHGAAEPNDALDLRVEPEYAV